MNDLSSCEYARLYEGPPISVTIERCLHHRKIKVQTDMSLDKIDNFRHVFPNAVTDDQQEELASLQVARDTVYKLSLIDGGSPLTNQLE